MKFVKVIIDGKEYYQKIEEGDIVEVEVTPNNFRRVAAQTAKQVIVQKIREAERGKIYDDFIEKENEILTAIVHSVDNENKTVYVELGKTEGALELPQHQIMLMPCAATRAELAAARPAVAEMCLQHGVRLGERLHLVLWDTKKGV